MSDSPQRRDDRIFDAGYVKDLGALPIDDLRSRRAECAEAEAELSYCRRLIQGKLDILRHEIERRAQGGDADLAALISNLPEILADEGAPTALQRHMTVVMPKNFEKQRRQVDRLASDSTLGMIHSLSSGEVTVMVERLKDAESTVSEDRRKVQAVIDHLNAELVHRYKEGTEDFSALLTS
ncbi:MAG: aerial mycelium formation protein [Actinobacteria bacterium]|nr:aerial mycelium formation protein [Actinomycetota bacterium]